MCGALEQFLLVSFMYSFNLCCSVSIQPLPDVVNLLS